MSTPRIGKPYPLTYSLSEGCNRCQCMLFEDDLVAKVDGFITCMPCVNVISNNDSIMGKANRTRNRRS